MNPPDLPVDPICSTDPSECWVAVDFYYEDVVLQREAGEYAEKCRKAGAELDWFAFCPFCGRKLSNEPKKEKAE